MKIAILGAGRMGAWLTEELCWHHEVMVHDSDLLKMKYFIKVHRALSIQDSEFEPELFLTAVLATPARPERSCPFQTVLSATREP